MALHSPASREPAAIKIRRMVGHGLWILAPVLSLSFLAWLPAAQAWWRARTAGWLVTALLLVAAVVGTFATLGSYAENGTPDESPWPGLLIIGAMIGGVISAVFARPLVFGVRPPLPRRSVAANPTTADGGRNVYEPAVQAVLFRRQRRQQAREIAATDPSMAYELGIGRPALDAAYDDGGLVDLNNVTAQELVAALGWERTVAEAYVVGRDVRGGYSSLDEIEALSGIEPGLLKRDVERVVTLPYRPQ